MKYECPVCLTLSLDEPYEHCSFDICRCCGVEYGYDDYVDHDDLERLQRIKHTELREAWIAAGRPHWWEDEVQQEGFDYGVSWLKEYYSDPERREIWERDLAKQLQGMTRIK